MSRNRGGTSMFGCVDGGGEELGEFPAFLAIRALSVRPRHVEIVDLPHLRVGPCEFCDQVRQFDWRIGARLLARFFVFFRLFHWATFLGGNQALIPTDKVLVSIQVATIWRQKRQNFQVQNGPNDEVKFGTDLSWISFGCGLSNPSTGKTTTSTKCSSSGICLCLRMRMSPG